MTGPALKMQVNHKIEREGNWKVPLGFIPPIGLRDGLICAGIASDGRHDSEIVLFDDFLHHLNSLQVSQHVSAIII